ncbi:MAG TPA: PilZ domain-containing protein [Acidimicrobiales bacterium]|jgi:hypothetical protein|nr:PilZ domain-containing protein [Acidimicrobiales bacterium]
MSQPIQPIVERRAGDRVPASIRVDLVYDANGEPADGSALIVDVSISGARLVTDVSDHLTIGTYIGMDSGAGRAIGIVRRCERGFISGKAFYGVQFVEFDDRFRGLLFATISDGLRGSTK